MVATGLLSYTALPTQRCGALTQMTSMRPNLRVALASSIGSRRLRSPARYRGWQTRWTSPLKSHDITPKPRRKQRERRLNPELMDGLPDHDKVVVEHLRQHLIRHALRGLGENRVPEADGLTPARSRASEHVSRSPAPAIARARGSSSDRAGGWR